MGSLEDSIIASNIISFSERSAIKLPDINVRKKVCMHMEKIVEKIPKKLIDKKFWKNSGFFITYPTENTIGGTSREKNT